MKDLDIVAFQPRNWFGRLIAWLTNSPYSHIGIVLNGEQEMMVEARLTVRVTNLRPDKRSHVLYTLKTPLTAAQITAAKTYLSSMLGAGYDFPNLLDIFINMFRRALNRTYRSYWQRDGRPVCSELVARAYGAAGVILCHGKPLWAITPGDIISSGYFREVTK